MKRVGGNVSIEKVAQSKPNAVTITHASSSNSHDDNNADDDYYDEDEEEFEPSPPVVRTPNLSQVQITPRNVSRPALNITPVAQPGGNPGVRSLPQVSANIESNVNKIPDRPFKIFSKENKSFHNDDDIIIESTSLKSSAPNFVKPNTPVRNLVTPIRGPNLRMNRPALPPPPHMPRARSPSLRGVSPRLSQSSPVRGPLPQPQIRSRMPMHNRGRPRGPYVAPYQRAQTPPAAGRMQFNPRGPRHFSSPRTPNVFNPPRVPSPRIPTIRQGRPQASHIRPVGPITRKLSSQIQITPRPAAPKPPSPAQAAVSVKAEPADYEEEYDDESDSYEDETPANVPPKSVLPQKFSKVNITPAGVSQPARGAPPVTRLSNAVQITPKISSQVQITPRPSPHVSKLNKQVDDELVNIKEEPMETEPSGEHYDEYQEEQGEEYYSEYEEEEENYNEYDTRGSLPQVSSSIQMTPTVPATASGKSLATHVLPATPVSLANIKQGPIIKEEPKDEDGDAELQDDYYDEEHFDETSQPSEPNLGVQTNASSRVSSSVQITPKLGSQVQLTPQNKTVQPNTLLKVSSSIQITPTKQSPRSESDEQFDDSYEGEEEEEEYYDEDMDSEQMADYSQFPQASTVAQIPPSLPQAQTVPNKFSITPNAAQTAPVVHKKISGVSIMPNKPQSGSFSPIKTQGVSITPNIPKGVSITPNKFQNISINKNQSVPVAPNLPKGISITPKKAPMPNNVSLTSNKAPGISITPRANPQVSHTLSSNIQQETDPYYEEEMGEEELGEEEEMGEEEESFEDYEEDHMIENHMGHLKRHDASPHGRSENIPIATNVSSLKSVQPKVETRPQHLAKPTLTLENMNAPLSQETRNQSTPTKPSCGDAKKPVSQGKSPSTNSYQSPVRQDTAPHGRPRSLIEAISMISSGKLCVSNLSTPSTSKKTTPKKEESTEKHVDSKSEIPEKELVSDKSKFEENNSNGATNLMNTDDATKSISRTLLDPLAPIKDENVLPVLAAVESNDINNRLSDNTKSEVRNIDDNSKSPRTKMRPKSKLLQFRKQTKNLTVPENNPETDESKTNPLNNLEMQSTNMISDENVNEDKTSSISNETSSVNDKHLNIIQNDSTELETVGTLNHVEETVSLEVQLSNQKYVVIDNCQENSKINSTKSPENQTRDSNSEAIDEEMTDQANFNVTAQEDNIKNDTGGITNTHTNFDTIDNRSTEADDSIDNNATNIAQDQTIDMMDQSNENVPESNGNILPPDNATDERLHDIEEKMVTEGDEEIQEELDEDMAEKIMREQEDEYQTSGFNNTEEEQGGDDPQEEEEEEEGDDDDGDEETDEDDPVDKEEEDASTKVREGEGEDKETTSKTKPKKKGNKRKKAKKRTTKRKSTDNMDETPAAKKSKTDDDDAKEGEDKDDAGDKSGSNKAINLRKNIRDVIDENQLDPATLAAQREEAERLKRVQEQQQRLKEVQRQIAQNNKAAKMMNLLEGENSGSSKPSPVVFNLSSGSLNKQMLELLKSQKKEGEEDEEGDDGSSHETAVSKLPNLEVSSLAKPLNITSSVSLVPVKKPTEPAQKAKVTGGAEVTVSDSDEDCILISEPSEDEGEGEDEGEDPSNSGMHTNDAFNVPDETGRVLVNLAHEPAEPDIFLAPQIARIIKPHQIGGIRFLFDNIIETTERYKTSPGFGCILAHSMGLGKTLQIVSFSDIFLRHTEGRTVVCIMPINTLQNWVSEFNMWLPLPADLDKSPLLVSGEVRPREFPIFILNDFQRNLPARAKVIKDWYTQGGVLMIGYELYRQLSLKKPKKTARRGKTKPEEEPDDKKQQLLEEIYEALVSPGPDLVICDEGHRIKNSHASTSHALKQIKTRRRVVLTGYPLQNNLLEYWCMVDFVRPNYLGTKTEFSNMFERPIQNGQCVDSTPQDVRLMRHRAHVLHSLLQGFVQRRSHMVLQKTLPVKEEYVLLIRMTPLQRQLYETFMNEVVRTKAVPNPLKAFAVCCKIWNHPDVLYNFLKKRQGGTEDVVADLDIEENAAIVAGCDPGALTPGTPTKRGSRSKGGGRNTGAANKNARKGSSPKGQEGGAKSPAVATVMPNINPSPVPTPNSTPGAYNYNYPGGGSENYNASFNSPSTSEANTFPSPAYYSNPADTGNSAYWNQTPPYSNTSGYHTDNSSNFTDMTDSSMNQAGFSQNMNAFGGYSSNEFNMQGENGSYSSSGYSGNTFGTGASDGTSYNAGFSSTNNSAFNVNSSMYNSSSPFESNAPASNQNTGVYDSNQFNSTNAFGESSNMFSTNQMPVPAANTSAFSSNQMPVPAANTNTFSSSQMPSSAADLDSTGGLVDMMLSEFPTPNPFDETRSNAQAGEKTEDLAGVPGSSNPASSEGEKGEVLTEDKEKGESSGDPEKPQQADSTTPVKSSGREEPGIPYDWAEALMKDYVPGQVEEGNKMVVFMCILEQSLAAGDRILVFSQSLTTLTLIEQFLQKRFVPGRQDRWARNKNYFRLDGSTISTDREKLINEFNSNDQVAMFLVSTRAGSLGINLVGANRVIVFDASWNPCHDTQAVCRVYRYGQQKPCFVYRLVMDSCLEKKIYDRQINKQGMADRVVDECNPDAHLSIKEVTNLCWDNEPVPDEKDFSSLKDKYRDSIIQLILDLHSFKLSKEPFQHESLLVDRKDKKLSTAEKRLAKRSYELEKQAQTKPVYGGFKNNLGKPMASVRPMQSLGGMNMLREGIGAPRNRQWIPAEVWQKQGMSAQEMKLPLDVIIPTNSNERSIVLKKDQKVMVLKSPKGIYMQLENGKIIAIRTANNKGGALGGLGGGKDMLGGLGGMTNPRPSMRMNSTPRVIDSRFARDVSMRPHGPRPRHMMSRHSNPRPTSLLHRGPTPTPRFKNVSITPSRPNLVKRNTPTHSVSCGTTTSPPSSPSVGNISSPGGNILSPSGNIPSPSGSIPSDKTPKPVEPLSELKDRAENASAEQTQSSPSAHVSPGNADVESNAQDLTFSQPVRSSFQGESQMSSSLRGDSQITSSSHGESLSSLRGENHSSFQESLITSSLHGESQITSSLRDQSMGRSTVGDSPLMSSSMLRNSQSLGSALRGDSQSLGSSLRGDSQSLGSSLRGDGQSLGSSLRGDSQSLGLSSQLMGSSLLGDSALMASSSMMGKSQSLGSAMLEDTRQPLNSSLLAKSEPLRTSADDLSLMNFDPAPSSNLDYSYDYPQYATGGTSDFYSTQNYQHTPVSTPASSSYMNSAAESSSYPYDMYSGVNPFTSAAPSNSSFTPVSGYGNQSSAFHRPETYQQVPPAYPPQYPSEYYPPPP